nr:RNA-directed DNA polymerase, eukaryota [Tanacetum cinerariifolium]
DGECIILGDFNEVRSENERFGSNFNEIGAKAFNHFISSSCLIDLPLEGRLSDHRPILLRESTVDYGPTPFRKFQALKARIKNWSRDEMHKASAVRHSAQSRISELDKLIDKGLSNNDIINERISLLKDIHDPDKRHSSNLAQKAKIQWAIEGDENSKYFHGIINKKRSQLAIRGVLVDGEWIKDPPKVKNQFIKHFTNRFSMPTGQTINLDSHMFQKISIDQNADLESDVSLEEIKKAHDVVNDVKEFFSYSKFPPRSNSSFITLIPKYVDAKMVKDFHPISLIEDGFKRVFLWQWDRFWLMEVLLQNSNSIKANVITIVNMIKCFYLAPGLKINIQKSKIMGIGTSQEEVDAAANVIGCNTFSSPFNYMDVKVGSSSSRSNFWDEVIAKLSFRLSKWKIKTLSIGGRFTLNKAVLSSLPIYLMSIYKTHVGVLRKMESIRRRFLNGAHINENKMSMIGWEKIMASRKKGGLAMYGDCGALDNTGTFVRYSTWTTIVRECGNLSSKDCNKISMVEEKINASSISCSFRRQRRGSFKEEQFSKLIEDVNSVTLSISNDRWIWSLDSSGEFSIISTRLYIDDHLLLAVGAPTRWVKEVPIKTNIMVWKVSLDKLPTRLNLYLWARNITTKVARWWEFDCSDLFSYDDWLEWFHTLCFLKGFKDILEDVFYVKWWVIWKYRNQTLFGSSQPRMDMLFDEIILLSFTWCSNRCKNNFDWILDEMS